MIELLFDPELKDDRFNFEGESLSEDAIKEPKKSYTKEQRLDIWTKKNEKITQLENEFKTDFSKIYKGQEQEIIKHLETNGTLPESLNDEKTAKKFEPTIAKTYLKGYEEAK